VRVGVCVVWSDTNKWPAAGTKKKTRKDYNYYSEMLLVLVFLFIFLGYGTASRLFFAFPSSHSNGVLLGRRRQL
jgi:hypothetical protein